MSSKIQKLSILAGLLAAATWTTTEAGPIVNVNNYATGNTFTYTSGSATALADATVNMNMEQGAGYVSPLGGTTASNPPCAYLMWHFTTSNANVTFGNDLMLSGQVLYNTTWSPPGWEGSDIFVLTSTVGSVAALNTGTDNWAWVHEGAWTETFTQKSLGGAGAGFSDFYVAFKVLFPETNNGHNWQVQFFKDNNPFVLTGSLNTIPEPASLALLGRASGAVLSMGR